jgi:phage-related protein (TIGR01555 family)
MRDDIAAIVHRYNVNVLKTDISAILEGSTSDQDVASLRTRIELFTKLANNFGVMVLDREREEWEQFNMALNGLDKLVQQNLEYIPIICQIPATKLFGTSPTGFGSSGEHELKTFYDLIKSEQTNKLLPHIERIFESIQYELFGEYDPNIKFRFNSLEQQSDLDRSIIFSNYVNAYGAMVDRGQITIEESRLMMANREELEMNSLDTEAEITNLEDNDNDEPDEDQIG